MSNISKNPLVRFASGSFGKHFVYRTRGNTTSIVQMPTVNKNAVPTEKQISIQDEFAASGLYATGAMSSPDLKRDYEKKAKQAKRKTTGFNIARRDYLKAPKVLKIDTVQYNGTIGSIIAVTAKDDFRVESVKVSIRDIAGALIEEGIAVQHAYKREKWMYTATVANAALTGTKISATAFDVPGNEGSFQLTL